MRRSGVLALASIAVVLAVATIYTAHTDILSAFEGDNNINELVSADDLERATFIDPAQWTAFKDLKKEQTDIQHRIKKLSKQVTKLAPEKTRVIVQVAPPGLPGRAGPKGVRGPIGPAGPRGLTGVPGEQGLRGKTGPRGQQGVAGIKGFQGPEGPRGPTGAIGDEGKGGVAGETGNPGPPGPQGRPGPAGPVGESGPQGPRGNTGPVGMAGPQGISGVRGVQGPDVNCKWVDVCGICDGDESSCALKRTPDTCHAIGDPHYRTFDGYAFNYQNTGEFILAKHLEDFEVQNKQRVCPNPDVRCNMGVAVKAAGHILIFYADWGTTTALLDGQQFTVPQDVRHVINDDLNYQAGGNQIIIKFQDAAMRAVINPWDNTHFMDLYIDAPARWSSGRSLTGLCWNFNGDIADDDRLLGVAGQFWVGDSPRSLFSNPRPAGLGMVAGSMSLAAADTALLNIPQEQMLVEQAPNADAEANVQINFKSEAQRLKAEAACADAHGHDKQDCMYDVVAGESGDTAGDAAALANLIDHEKLLQVCLLLRSSPAAMFNATRLDPPQNQEGYSFSFWYIPTEAAKPVVTSIMGKGNMLSITVLPNTHKLHVQMGNSQCDTQQDLVMGTWVNIGVAVSEVGALTVWVNGDISCTNNANGGQPVPLNTDSLVVGETSMAPATGRIGRLYYMPLTLTNDQIKRYSNQLAPGESCPVTP